MTNHSANVAAPCDFRDDDPCPISQCCKRDTAAQPAVVEPSDRPRLFHLQRDHDVSGVSGTGRVANGVLWPDGTVSLRWIGERPSTVHWDRLADAEHVHGHGGATRIMWADEITPSAEVWSIWREGQSVWGYYATEDAAKADSIHYWEEDEPVCPDYSWRPFASTGWELLVGSDASGVFITCHKVHGQPTVEPPVDRAAILREAADAVFALDYDVMVGEEGDENLGSMREAWDLGTIHAEKLLRRLADEAQQP